MGIGNIGWTEFLVILAIALVFFGPRRLPGIAQTIGKSLREFQKALNEVKSEIAQAGRESDTRAPLKSILPKPSDLLDPSQIVPGPSPPQQTSEGADVAAATQPPARPPEGGEPAPDSGPQLADDLSESAPANAEDENGNPEDPDVSERRAG